MKDKVRFVSDGTAILSMRESDFDAYSAYGEVVDNSIQAGAKKIKVQLTDEKVGGRRTYRIIKELAFGDDGKGMDENVLHRCLQLGYSSRYNDRGGIGRFGVGMTLAAINQCKRVEVFSKQEDGEWLWTFLDLDDLSSDPPKADSIAKPKKKKLPSEYKNLVGEESGTLVIWKNYDRQPDTAQKILEEMKVWFGRTYRYFIWEGVELFVNAEAVPAIDPLYVNPSKTKFPEDPPAHAFDPFKIDYPVPETDPLESEKKNSVIEIRMSLIDKSLRAYEGVGGAKPTRDRYINHNQGVSILRNKREVFYGPIPYWPGAGTWFEEIDRWWGCEISFDAVLDRAFTVKNIKRGAIPNKELKELICDKITPTRKTCLERVRSVWAADKQAKQEERRKESGAVTGHEESEEVASKTPTDKSQIDKDTDIEKEAPKIVDKVAGDRDAAEKAALLAKFKDQPFTIVDGNWKGPLFMEINHLGGSDVIQYNRAHPFFDSLYSVVDGLSEEEGSARDLKCLIDLLLISYAKAEAKFEAGNKFDSETFLEMLGANWGMYLKTYISTWKEET